MNTLTHRLRTATGADPEAGSVTVFVAISVLGLLLLIGLVADGGAKLRATQRADSVAAEAARLVVTVTDTAPTAFLSLIGISTLTVTGHGEARLIDDITGGGP